MEYTSYERVKQALEHKEADRVPFDIGGALVAGININVLKRLSDYLGLKDKINIYDKITQLGQVNNELIERLGIDIVNVAPGPPKDKGLFKDMGLDEDHYKIIDEFGIGWKMPEKGGHFYDLYLHPLKDAQTLEDIEKYPWPDPEDLARFINLKMKADETVYRQKKAYFLERMSAGMWENAMWMTGYEKFFMDMVTNKKLIHAIMEKFLEIKMKYWQKALDAVGKNVMIISTADDLGTRDGLLVSLELYRELIWPYHKRLFEFIKDKAQSKTYIFFHNDGAIKDTIPLLIEAGVDILNPVQVNCKGMDDTKLLKKEFGKDVTFWGGSCDNSILAFGTPKEVKEETKRRIDDLAPGGGFIFASIHVIQSVVPVKNLLAWWETLQEYGKY